MSIDPMKIDSAVLQQSSHPLAVPSGVARDSSQNAAVGEGAPADQVLLSGSLGKTYHDLQLKNVHHEAVATAIGKTDRAAEAVGQKIDAVKAPLLKIVKNYPPFSPEDKERVKLLMSYSSLRKEIDALTLPPPPEVVKARKAEELPPPLHATADDSQIADHIAKLDAVGASLDGMRNDLAARTATFLPDGGFSAPISGPEGAQNPRFDAALSESAALHTSAEVGRQFAISFSQGVTAPEHSQFLKRLS
jgi:hypothetical protein